jgi:hypothetical protein
MRETGVHCIIYGEPKSGKSTLVSKLLKSGKFKLWWFSLDNGHEVLWKLNLKKEELDDRLELFVIPDTREFPVALKTVRAVCSGRETFICDIHGQAGCSTCKRDSKTFSKICLDEFTPKDILVIDHAGQLSNAVTAYISIDRTKTVEEAGVYKMSLPDWGVHGAILDGIFTNIQQSKANIVVITHTVESELEDGSKRLLPQIGSVNFSRNSAKYFGHVIYLQVTNRSHKAGSSTTFATTAITGSRTDIAVEGMKEPDLDPFFDGRIKNVQKEEHGSSIQLAPKSEIVSPPKVTEEKGIMEGTQTKTEEVKVPSKLPSNLAARLAMLNNKGKE